jgi:two-component system response regulator NreC
MGRRRDALAVNGRYRVVLVEDHTILREGLRALLASEPEFEVVGEFGDGRDAVARAAALEPDLVLTDLAMPRMNGLEAIREIRKRVPGAKMLALTVHKAEEYVRAALQAGAHGYLLKDSSRAELLTAARKVLSGRTYISPELADLFPDGRRNEAPPKGKTKWESLTGRDREILKLIAEGNKNKDIARDLFISLKTVEKHRSNLMQKLGLHNAQALTALAIEKGLISLE